MQIGARTAALAESGGWAPVPNAYIDLTGHPQLDFGFNVGSSDDIVIDANPIRTTDIWATVFTAGDDWRIGTYYNNYYFGTQLQRYFWGRYNNHKRCIFRQAANVWYEKDYATGIESVAKTWSIPAEVKVSSETLKTVHSSVETLSFSGRIYNVSQSRNGVLLHDFYPREIDGVAGMFDTVTGDFKTNIQDHGSITYVEG